LKSEPGKDLQRIAQGGPRLTRVEGGKFCLKAVVKRKRSTRVSKAETTPEAPNLRVGLVDEAVVPTSYY